MFFDCFFNYMLKLNETVTELFLPSRNSRHCTAEPIDQGLKSTHIELIREQELSLKFLKTFRRNGKC
jgi:hypothetical protein